MKRDIRSILLIVFFIFVGIVYFNYSDSLTAEGIRSFVEAYGTSAPIVYGLLYIIILVLLFPATIASVLAGVIFGKFIGSIVVIVSATIAAGIAFYVTRYFGEGITVYLERGLVSGLIKKINTGAVNDEIIIDANGTELVSIITQSSVERLKLVENMEVSALIKASNIIVMK